MKPITVVIPVYNAEAYIRETIDSILCQTFSEFELLVIDDGSTDNSAAIILSYTDTRIRYIQCHHDYVATLNKGIELADGKYIALMEHDDLMMPYRLEIQYEFMESHQDITACGGYMHSFGINSEEMPVPLTHLEIIQSMLLRNPIHNSTGFIRRQFLTDHQIQYEQEYSFSANYKLWSYISQTGNLANIPKILTLHRTHQEQISIKYIDKYLESGQKVKIEMLDFLFCNLKKGDELADLIDRDFIPAINDFGEMDIFSEKLFFQFMYELIRELLKRKLIKI